jgi:hypothetical protein
MLKLSGNVAVAKAYRWSARSPHARAEGPCLIVDSEPGADYRSTIRRQYDPFVEQPALFRDFAELPAYQDAILEFATEFGTCFTPDLEPWTFRQWVTHIGDMANVVKLLDAHVHNDENYLKKIIVLDKSGRAEFRFGVAPTSRIPQLMPTTGQPDRFSSLLDAAAFLLRFVIKYYTTVDMQPQLERTTDGGFVLQFVTHELSEALWLQAALAAAGQKEYVPCKHCGRSIELSPRLNRADKQFCSDSCRAKHYYQQKQKAFALLGRGKSPQQIAEATGYDVSTVKGWFKLKRGGRDETKTKRARRR